MAVIKRKGFGQVEPNQLIGIVTAEFVDQTPVDNESVGKILEQGRFVQEVMKDGKIVLVKPGDAADADAILSPCVMIYNEEYFYDERDTYHKDFAMKAEDFIDEIMVPRCIRPVVLDKLTTNCFGANTDKHAETEGVELVEGDTVGVDDEGYFCAGAQDGRPSWVVKKVYTMPDGQPGVKLQCVGLE